MNRNVLICHGGGPTAVLNASLYGAITEAKKTPGVGKIYGAMQGTGSLVTEPAHLIDLTDLPQSELDLLPYTPASVIGSGRLLMNEGYFARICQVIEENDIGYVLLNGGNGTMRMVSVLSQCFDPNKVRVMGIPKTVDNDLAGTDHTPGFISCANYAITQAYGLSRDVGCAPLHVMILEVMGRDSGWLTCATALARREAGDGPHLIYAPENFMSQDKMLGDIDNKLCGRKGGILMVVSEALKGMDGQPFFPPIKTPNGDVLYGGMGSNINNLIVDKLHLQGRAERVGMQARADYHNSPRDRAEAIEMGQLAMRYAAEGMSGMMVGYRRVSNDPYQVTPITTPASEVAGGVKEMPPEFFNAEKNDVTDAFMDYIRPLCDEVPPRMARPLYPLPIGRPEFIIPGR
nr:diphosphate--fructose-6-phosphate 1-phosphotransferase [Maliibacterium massiliense]